VGRFDSGAGTFLCMSNRVPPLQRLFGQFANTLRELHYLGTGVALGFVIGCFELWRTLRRFM
jgi:thiosulfate reductase cytochrome b subunit